MSDDTTQTLVAVRVTDPGDPAYDKRHPRAQELVMQYARARDAASLAALDEITVPGKRAVRFELAPLDFAAVLFATSAQSPMEAQDRAFRCSCVAYTDAAGLRHEAKMITAGGADFPVAATTWSSEVARAFGVNAIREMGALALRRAEVTAEVVDPYWPLRGAPLLAL